jgi:Zn finger protein HypA/HybF involved in hydrogenase expression
MAKTTCKSCKTEYTEEEAVGDGDCPICSTNPTDIWCEDCQAYYPEMFGEDNCPTCC